MDIYDLFSKFELESLPKDWVQNLWKDDFSEAVEFPTEYEMFLENTDIGELMSSASKFIKEWLETPGINNTFTENRKSSLNRSSLNVSQVDSRSWQHLITNNVHHRALVAVLSIFISRGKTEKQFEVKRLGLIATDLYLVLLAIPGSQVFHIFNPILYSHAIESLKICSTLSCGSANSKPVAKKKRGRHQNDDDDDFEDEEEGNDSEDERVLPSDKNMVIKLLNLVLSDLFFALQRFQMKGQDDSLLLTIQILILITRLERSSTSLFLKSPSHNTVSYLAYKAYKILIALCSSDHGEVEEIVSFIMREIMSGFLIYDQKGLKLSPKEALVIKDHSIQFIVNLLRSLKDSAYLGVYTLIQHVCVRIPDKADLRVKGVQVVQELLDILPQSLYSHTVVWIMGLCHNDQVKNRITGLEIVTKLLHGNERIPNSPVRPILQKKKGKHREINGNAHDEDDEHDGINNHEGGDERGDEGNSIVLSQYPDFSQSQFLLATIFSRCKDVASSVRAKSLAILANLISSNNRNIKHAMESIFVTPYLHAQTLENSGIFEKGFLDFQEFLRNIRKESNPNVDPLPGAKAVLKLLELFVEDEKVFVRKSSLQVLANIFLINEKWMSNKLLQVMVDNCRDMSVSVRKLIVQCLTDLLNHYPSHPELPKYWVQGVMPLLADQEVKSQEKVLEALQSLLLGNLVAYEKMRTPHHALPWTLLGLIAENNKRQLFLYACHKWTLTNSLRQSLIAVLKSHIGTENNDAAWFLLASFSEYQDIRDPEFVLDYFYENVLNSQQVDEYCCQLVTEVMHLSWRQLPVVAQVNLCDNLLRHLAQFTVPLPMIARCIDICQLITETHADSPEVARERVKEWACNLISTCESILEKVIGPESPLVVADEDRLCQYIFSVGEVVLICPGQLRHSVLLLIQNLLEAEDNEEDEEDNGEAEKRWKGRVSAKVKAVAVATLGKLCLQKEHTAKVLVPLFASLLSETPHNEIKINAMIVLTDMCIKFTSVVENHLPEMCICLKDKDLQVRENTLTLMIQLIQEDYLKLRCPMLFHLLSMLNDEHHLIRDMISSFVINSLLVKQKNILVQHFVEGLFHYNAYMGHSTYDKGRTMGMRERTVFSLEGADRQLQRRLIYRFMLENMIDEHRFRVTYRLCTDILAGVAEGEIELSSSGTTLLQDALYVLSSDDIRLSQLRGANKDCDDEEPGDQAQVVEAVCNIARKTLISQVVKRNMIENVVPIFIKLKQKLKQLRSPLVRDLMASLRELMKDYKTEINEILAADKELAAEISHDLQTSQVEEEDESRERQILNDGEVLKKAVMEVVALGDVRLSLNALRTPQLIISRLDCSHTGDKLNRSANGTPSAKRALTSQPNGVSPEAKRTSGTSTPAGNSGASPASSKSSPNNSEPVKSPGNGAISKQSSPSSNSVTSDVCSQNEAVEVSKPVMKPRRSRRSTGSTCSEGSTTSRSSRSSRRTKKK